MMHIILAGSEPNLDAALNMQGPENLYRNFFLDIPTSLQLGDIQSKTSEARHKKKF